MERLVLKPHLTEKTYMLSQQGIFTFIAPINANRHQVAKNIEQEFNVKVESIKVAVQTGKVKSYNRGKRAYPGKRQAADTKKVYVRLSKGQTIPAFEQTTETNEKESK